MIKLRLAKRNEATRNERRGVQRLRGMGVFYRPEKGEDSGERRHKEALNQHRKKNGSLSSKKKIRPREVSGGGGLEKDTSFEGGEVS